VRALACAWRRIGRAELRGARRCRDGGRDVAGRVAGDDARSVHGDPPRVLIDQLGSPRGYAACGLPIFTVVGEIGRGIHFTLRVRVTRKVRVG
jgi:hypothetical protein